MEPLLQVRNLETWYGPIMAIQGLNLQVLPGRIVTEILPAAKFYPAEAYHQDYYRKNSASYTYYRWSCGRDRRLEKLWGPAPKS